MACQCSVNAVQFKYIHIFCNIVIVSGRCDRFYICHSVFVSSSNLILFCKDNNIAVGRFLEPNCYPNVIVSVFKATIFTLFTFTLLRWDT